MFKPKQILSSEGLEPTTPVFATSVLLLEYKSLTIEIGMGIVECNIVIEIDSGMLRIVLYN